MMVPDDTCYRAKNETQQNDAPLYQRLATIFMMIRLSSDRIEQQVLLLLLLLLLLNKQKRLSQNGFDADLMFCCLTLVNKTRDSCICKRTSSEDRLRLFRLVVVVGGGGGVRRGGSGGESRHCLLNRVVGCCCCCCFLDTA